jgi:hypothetical protein
MLKDLIRELDRKLETCWVLIQLSSYKTEPPAVRDRPERDMDDLLCDPSSVSIRFLGINVSKRPIRPLGSKITPECADPADFIGNSVGVFVE